MKEIERIIEEYQEAIAEAGSENERRQLKIEAFEAIAAEFDCIKQLRAEHAAEVKALIDEERLLDKNDGNLPGKARE